MKKLLVFLLVLTIFVSGVFALSFDRINANAHIGFLSGLGVSADRGKYEFGLDIESGFPTVSVLNKTVENTDMYINLQNTIGADAYCLYNIYSKGSGTISAGAQLFGGNFAVLKKVLILSAVAKYSYSIKDNQSLFVSAGCPLILAGFADKFVTFFPTYAAKSVYANIGEKNAVPLAAAICLGHTLKLGYSYSF